MSTAAGSRPLALERSAGRSVPRSHPLPLGLIIRLAAGAALAALSIFAIVVVPGHGDFSAAVRWAIAAMALDAVLSWIFIEGHLNPRHPRRSR